MQSTGTSSHTQIQTLYSQKKPAPEPRATSTAPPPESPTAKTSDADDFASLFDDSSLEKLQSNLEAIAEMAGRSLERIEA